MILSVRRSSQFSRAFKVSDCTDRASCRNVSSSSFTYPAMTFLALSIMPATPSSRILANLLARSIVS